MKKFKSITAILILSCIFSCTTKDYSELNGKWSFNSKDGSYGEFWIDSNYVLTIDEYSYDARVYNYEFKKDTIIALNFNVASRYGFYIKRLSNDKMLISDIYRDYDCIKITSEIKIDTSEAYKTNVYKEFGKRLSKH